MKKIFYAFLFCYLGFLMSGCDQDIDFPYEGKDRIQFQHYTVDYNDIRHYSDSIFVRTTTGQHQNRYD